MKIFILIVLALAGAHATNNEGICKSDSEVVGIFLEVLGSIPNLPDKLNMSSMNVLAIADAMSHIQTVMARKLNWTDDNGVISWDAVDASVDKLSTVDCLRNRLRQGIEICKADNCADATKTNNSQVTCINRIIAAVCEFHDILSPPDCDYVPEIIPDLAKLMNNITAAHKMVTNKEAELGKKLTVIELGKMLCPCMKDFFVSHKCVVNDELNQDEYYNFFEKNIKANDTYKASFMDEVNNCMNKGNTMDSAAVSKDDKLCTVFGCTFKTFDTMCKGKEEKEAN